MGKSRSQTKYSEVVRQIIHLGLGVFLAAILLLTSLDFFRFFLIVVFAAGVFVAWAANAKIVPHLNHILSHVPRPNENITGESAFLYVLGIIIPTFLFSDPHAVVVGIIALAFQDSFSTMIGMRFGKTYLAPNKSLEGAFGGFVMCTIGLLPLLSFPNAIFIAFIATIVEMLPLNDSFTIPFVSTLFAAFLI
ncbi:MAG: hypothetical protein AABX02_00810 [archaeon]